MSISSPRDLPSVDQLLQRPTLAAYVSHVPRELVVGFVRDELDASRLAILAGSMKTDIDAIAQRVIERLTHVLTPPLRPVMNATGVVIHTNLGRAPLSRAALEAVQATAAGYSNLEYDLERGDRGSRHLLVTGLLRQLTGAQDALITNNNAASMLLILAALGQGREAIISRGQLVEIGGGFRIPDVLRQSGVDLVEVGTTNRTYASDFDAAVTERTAMLLRVHASNFKQIGFTHTPTLTELVAVGARHNLPVVDDLGSGTLLDTSRFGLAHEPMVQESVADGAAVVAFSGDKLLGGPQAGIVVGTSGAIQRLRTHPLMRAIRPDKMTLAALAATLIHYLRGEAEREVPVWRMIAAPVDELEQRAYAVAHHWSLAEAVVTEATVGGGSLPGETLPSRGVSFAVPSPDALAARLRQAPIPVVGRIERDQLVVDVRTVLPEQDGTLVASLRSALG